MITGNLSSLALAQFCLSNLKCYALAIPFLWKDVELVDQWKLYPDEHPSNAADPPVYCYRGKGVSDEHDDTPIIRKLVTLAR